MPLPTSVPGIAALKSTGPTSGAPASGPVGNAPSATSGYSNSDGTDPSGWDWSQALSGAAGYKASQTSQNYIYNPAAANYTIAGIGDYQAQQKGIEGGYQGLGNTASQQTNALANTANNQNTAYQGNVNSTTSAFLGNNQGAYDSSQASQGSNQQNAAYNAVTNMAQGNGPSLAAKNLQAGLNQQNQVVQAQSMSNQGLGGAGNASRNALNAQAANTNNQLQTAQQASTAEQLGALSQQSTAANDIRSSNQAQASAASSAGLTARGQNESALSNQYSANLAGNQAADNTALSALGLGYSTQGTTLAGQASASNNIYNSNAAQQQASEAYDQALQSEGNIRAQINTNSVQSQAAQNQGVVGTLGNIVGGITKAVSDQNMKTITASPSGTSSALQSILGGIGKVGDSIDGNIDFPTSVPKSQPITAAPTAAPAAPVAAPTADNKGLDADIANKPPPPALPQISSTAGTSSGGSSSGGGGGGGGIGGVISSIIHLFSDERTKKDIEPGDTHSKEFMDNLKPATFRYKDESVPGTTKGVNLGVMAQDMQKSAMGRELVEQGSDGLLRYSVPKAVNLSLASLAFLNKRLNKLEGARK